MDVDGLIDWFDGCGGWCWIGFESSDLRFVHAHVHAHAVGFSTIDLMGGKPTLDAVVDTEIEAFYTKGCVADR